MSSAVNDAIIDTIELRPLSTVSANADKEQEVHVRMSAADNVEVVDSPPTHEAPARTPVQTMKMKLHIAALCWAMFLYGWNDGTTGPLLPKIQKVYHVNSIIVALIFVANCVGMIFAGLANVYLNERFGFGKVVVLGSVVCIAAFSIQAAAPPFPLFVVSFAISGFGVNFLVTHGNGYLASFEKSSTRLSLLHCAYGVGAFGAPLVSTQFAQLKHWSFQYLISLGLAISTTIVLIAVFRFRTQDECRLLIGEVNSDESVTQSQGNAYLQIIRMKTVHFFALFLLAYVGVEVTVGGWIVSYTVEVRDGGPTSGYLSSGFFGGLALGRVALLWVTKKLGNRPAVLTYMLVAIGLELIVWLVPSFISGAVAIALLGLILGPIYPIAMNETSKVLPRWILTNSIGWIAAFGTSGSAALPFIAGVLAQEKGISSLQPLLVSMMAVMVLLWLVIPRGHARLD